MSRHFFIYAKNIFFTEGVRSMVADFSPCEEKFAFSKFEAFSQLIDTLRLPAQEDEQRCILCDIDSLPDERINALHTIKECYCEKNQQLVLLLGKIIFRYFLHCILFSLRQAGY